MADNHRQAGALAERLQAARRVCVLTGAGMSAESGIPTFRGTGDSLWSRFDPMQLATAEAWQEDCALVWAWYRWRMALVAQAPPNAGHRALAALAPQVQGLQLVTQNVDDLHERAGSDVAAHLHGSLFALRCFDCGHPHPPALPPLHAAEVPQRLPPPRCAQCDGTVRPGVVWFGEALPDVPWQVAVEAARCEVMLVVGTSGLVQPAASLPRLARQLGSHVVEINPQRSALSEAVHVHWQATAATALPLLFEAMQGR